MMNPRALSLTFKTKSPLRTIKKGSDRLTAVNQSCIWSELIPLTLIFQILESCIVLEKHKEETFGLS